MACSFGTLSCVFNLVPKTATIVNRHQATVHSATALNFPTDKNQPIVLKVHVGISNSCLSMFMVVHLHESLPMLYCVTVIPRDAPLHHIT